EAIVDDKPCAAALGSIAAGRPTAIVYLKAPALDDLVELSHAARGRSERVALALPAPSADQRILLEVAGELGLCAVSELKPLCALCALLEIHALDAAAASPRALNPADRARLMPALDSARDGRAQFLNIDALQLGYRSSADAQPVRLGEAADVREALFSLRRLDAQQREVESSVEVDARAVMDVIFGPKRALSDPASKNALAPYGIPLPVEELCGSASRAASEATRIGYPVRISLASPDLRIWDHPDLCVDMVDNAARVRDTFRQLIAAAEARFAAGSTSGSGRILGVVVSATNEPLAELGVTASALPHRRVAIHLGFADPHGRAAGDQTATILPAELPVIERALRRLAGADLLLDTSPAQRKARVDNIADLLQQIAAFVNDRREQIRRVELRPLVVLLDGTVEVREACVSVSDWFERNA
ncbi:MAG TPA: acetate--CoA ligase family protein, partial [Polyangiales bacterium]|nr:acetate--CoA ligase family protein [Polyangiales bacterium]